MFAQTLGEETVTTSVPAVIPVSQPVPLYSVNPLYIVGGVIVTYLLYQYFYGDE
jgi:hypothetical protein